MRPILRTCACQDLKGPTSDGLSLYLSISSVPTISPSPRLVCTCSARSLLRAAAVAVGHSLESRTDQPTASWPHGASAKRATSVQVIDPRGEDWGEVRSAKGLEELTCGCSTNTDSNDLASRYIYWFEKFLILHISCMGSCWEINKKGIAHAHLFE